MKLSDFTVQRLALMICGDLKGWPYRRGTDLVKFFNQFGFRDAYGQGFPARAAYAEEKLRLLNGKPVLRDVVRCALEPRLWFDLKANDGGTVEQAADAMTEQLRYDGYEVLRDGLTYKVRDLSGAVVTVETPFSKASKLSELLIEEQIKKCRDKIDVEDYSGAITNARSLVEAVLLKIEEELGDPNPTNDGDVVQLFNRVRKKLNLDPSRKDISDSLKQVLAGLSSIVNGLAGMRNRMSDSHAANYKPGRHHAKLAVNAAKTLADFLFETMAYQESRGLIGKGGSVTRS